MVRKTINAPSLAEDNPWSLSVGLLIRPIDHYATCKQGLTLQIPLKKVRPHARGPQEISSWTCLQYRSSGLSRLFEGTWAVLNELQVRMTTCISFRSTALITQVQLLLKARQKLRYKYSNQRGLYSNFLASTLREANRMRHQGHGILNLNNAL